MKNKVFSYSIPSNLGTGFQWTLKDTSKVKILDHFAKSNGTKSAYTDMEVFKLKCGIKGKHTLMFYYLRPFYKIIDTSNVKVLYQKIRVK